MDIFIEKLVVRKKTLVDYLIVAAMVIVGFVVSLVLMSVRFLQGYQLLVTAVIIYAIYFFIKTRSIEYEYAVTNGELDIDKIVAQRKRSRVFSLTCKEFEMVARVDSEHLKGEYSGIKNVIQACSDLKAEGLYFIVANYKGLKTLVYFEPDERMLKAFKTFIPKKVFI